MRTVPPAARPRRGVALSGRRTVHRLAAWSGAALLVAAACSSSGADRTTDGAAPATTGGGAPGEVQAPSTPPATGDDGAAPATTAPRSPGTDPTTTSPPATAAAPEPPDEPPAPGAVGSYAPVYLRPGTGSRVVVEIRSQDGAGPSPSTIEHLRGTLAAVTGKEIAFSGGAVEGGARDWTGADIRAVADASPVRQSRGAPVMRILFLGGGFAESDTVVGIAVRADVAAVFSDRVDEAAGLVGDRARVERAVTLHEAGHLLGLVDLHLDTGRDDPDHPGHSTNRGSVMYYAVESTLVGTILSGGPPTDFDEQDRADLATIRRGA